MKIAHKTLLVMLLIAIVIVPAAMSMRLVSASSPDHPAGGAVSGRVTTQDTSVGIPHARVAIVNAASGQELYIGASDQMGFYQFPRVENTWDSGSGQYAQSYKIHVTAAIFGDGYSSPFAVEERSTAPANVAIYSDIEIATATPTVTPTATASPTVTAVPSASPTPSAITSVTPMPPADHSGAVCGRITAGDPSTGAPNAYVAIVLASDPSQRLYVGSTDSNGFYQFAQVQDTLNSGTGTYDAKYKLYAKHSMLGEGYSNAFAVEARSVAPANVQIAPTPIPTPVATATPAPAATPTATPLPLYPVINVTSNSSLLNVTGNMVYAPEGTSLDSLARDGRIAMQVPPCEDGTSSVLVLRVTPVNNSTATISDASLMSQKEATLNGRNVTVYASADLNGVPGNATLGINVTAPEDADGRLSEALSRVGLNNSSKVLAVVEVIKGNLENGRDIKSGSLIISMPRPADFDPSGSYKVVRESDGQYTLLDARLISSPDVETLTFEVISPGGFSTFTLVAVAAQASALEVGTRAQPAAGDSGSLLGTILIDVLLAVMLVALLGIVVYWQVFRNK